MSNGALRHTRSQAGNPCVAAAGNAGLINYYRRNASMGDSCRNEPKLTPPAFAPFYAFWLSFELPCETSLILTLLFCAWRRVILSSTSAFTTA